MMGKGYRDLHKRTNDVLKEFRQCCQEKRSFRGTCDLQSSKELLGTVGDLCGHREQS